MTETVAQYLEKTKVNKDAIDSDTYTFRFWLTHNNLFSEIEQGEILMKFHWWLEYGNVGQFAVWLSEFGRKRRSEEWEMVGLKVQKRELSREQIERIRDMIKLHTSDPLARKSLGVVSSNDPS